MVRPMGIRFILAFLILLPFSACRLSIGDGESKVELAEFMGALQHHSQKLGLSIQAKNSSLSNFYLHETEEVLEELKEIEEYEGLPIKKPVRVIMDELVQALADSLRSENWKRADADYRQLIDGCNRCHASQEVEFIKILPRTKHNPFAQDFSKARK